MNETLDAVLAAGVDSGAVPGVTATVVNRDGVVWEGAAGERSIGGGAPMAPDTPGAIFSMTKAITGAAAMQLVEQGRLDLDAPAGQVCDELADPQVLTGFDADGQPQTRPAVGDVTLRNLLTHTSGFTYADIWNSDIGKWCEVTETPSLFSLLLSSLSTPLAFDPGTRWEYGTGIDWAGQMVERASGMTLGEYFAANVTGPLGMNDTTFAPDDALISRAAGMHARTPDGMVPIELPAAEAPEFEMGGGGLFSTMPDYGRFIRMMLNDGELDGNRILSSETVAEMSQNHIGNLRVTELVSHAPGFSNDAELFPGEEKSWGLTFQIHEEAGSTGRPAGTLMWAGLANSYYCIDRANGIGAAYMTQILPFGDEGSLNTYYDLERTMYANVEIDVTEASTAIT